MFGLGPAEILLVLIVAFLVLGPDKLLETAKTVGQFAGRMNREMQELRKVVMAEEEQEGNGKADPPPKMAATEGPEDQGK